MQYGLYVFVQVKFHNFSGGLKCLKAEKIPFLSNPVAWNETKLESLNKESKCDAEDDVQKVFNFTQDKLDFTSF